MKLLNSLRKKIAVVSSLKSLVSHLPFTVSLFTCLLLFFGCDQTFQPIRDNSIAPFSIFGYLDASADTQWVRVAPIRKQISMSAEDIPDMTITVEDMQTGNTAIMYDSLFQIPDGRNVLNAWGTMDFLKPEQTYTLQAEREDGAESHVEITFPPDFPTPRLEIKEIFDQALLYIEGVENLVTVQVRTLARVISPSAGWDYVDVFWTPHRRIDEIRPGEYRVLMKPDSKFNVSVSQPPRDDLVIEYLHHQVFVASGGPEWNKNLSDLSDIQYSLPEVISNVENGTGYMFGIVSKSIPFKNCFNDQGEFIACPEEVPLH